MDKRVFSYNADLFRSKLLKRTAVVLSLFLLFLAYNTFQLPGSERLKFLSIFGPMFLLLVWFLRKNFIKQVDMLKNGRIEIEGGVLKQFDAHGSCATIRLKDIEKITQDDFRSYDRLVVETKEKFYPIVNIKELDSLRETLEEASGQKTEFDPVKIDLMTWKTAVWFLPSVIFVAATFLPKTFSFSPLLNQETALLIFNINLILFFLYMPEKKNYVLPGFSFKRRMIFMSGIVFLFQVYVNLERVGFFRKEG
ncbi:hypothetical protein [Leptospira idonii]|uniref:Uncharacterized protein n=1 Tax=Leptospira idonii TaxID=1193500 RepID=A0A4V3JXV8_9LEPT|nr:hypothetical protein [Leptospira idonii]TGN17871.1 hypothetical protein EHS15_15955 [Leptospira idonii]